jgi:hypothetical protein
MQYRAFKTALTLMLAGVLAACGGGGVSTTPPAPLSCTTAQQQDWLRSYFADWYFWYRLSPSPAPSASTSVGDYFSSLIYAGGDPVPGGPAGLNWPRDRWSNFESTESFNRFFGDGQTLGYGLAVAGLEVVGAPSQPLYVRYVEPLSPAALAGVVRGDQIMSLNGRAAADLVAADDFSALSARNEGDALLLVLRNAGVERTLTLTARIFALTPVQRPAVVSTSSGGKIGYVFVKDMISQARSPLASAFAEFRNQGVSEVIIDLRYNGGGLVSVGSELAGYVGGANDAGKVFASLLYNDRKAASNNSTFRFPDPAAAASLGVRKAYVLAGRRTCSASEQVVNGLRGVGIEVVLVGESTCGKPFGFLPADQCGQTYSVVNFESVNALNQGRYFEGFSATCPVAEDFTRTVGAVGDPLFDTALRHAAGGGCGSLSPDREKPLLRGARADRPEPGERQGMIPR